MAVLVEIKPGWDIGLIKKANKELGRALEDNRKLFRDFAPILGQYIVKDIESGGRLSGANFKPLDKVPERKGRSKVGRPRTKRRRKRKGGPLLMTGKMAKRIMSKSKYRRKVTRRMMRYGPSLKTDKIAMGGSYGGSIPSRNPLRMWRGPSSALNKLLAEKARRLLKEYAKSW